MSLAARIALDPSRRVAFAERAIPLLGLGIALATLGARWPAATILLVAAIVLVGLLVARRGSSRAQTGPYRLTLSNRGEFGVVLADGSAIDARLVESTVAWPGFWILAFAGVGSSRVIRLAVLPSELRPDARWALSRFLIDATGNGGRVEIPPR